MLDLRNYKPAPVEYFNNAFNFYRKLLKNPLFVVVSDDKAWCRKVFQTDDVVYVLRGFVGSLDHDFIGSSEGKTSTWILLLRRVVTIAWYLLEPSAGGLGTFLAVWSFITKTSHSMVTTQTNTSEKITTRPGGLV